jgi:prepilin-type N-terminal cleavage/methylation domain-containing protein
MKVNSGFSIVELLIAITLTGLIATFAIPKIMTATQNANRDAVFKETEQVVFEALEEGVIKGTITQGPGVSWYDYLATKLNYRKGCRTGLFAGGCVGATYFNASRRGDPGFVMPNGAIVIAMNFAFGDIFIDWNGEKGPNETGKDVIQYVFVPPTESSDYCGVPAGDMGVPEYGCAGPDYYGRALYEDIHRHK